MALSILRALCLYGYFYQLNILTRILIYYEYSILILESTQSNVSTSVPEQQLMDSWGYPVILIVSDIITLHLKNSSRVSLLEKTAYKDNIS